MVKLGENDLSELLQNNVNLRLSEPHIYTVYQNTEVANSYDTGFGNIYDWVACNPLYNRFIWGYSIAKFASFDYEALTSSNKGYVLDLGCGSLAFTAQTYIQYSDRPVVLIDQSLKMLKIAKSRLIQINGKVPDNMVFINADALQLPFKPNSFNTIISLNLLHCLDDINKLMIGLKNVLSTDGKMYFSTLVKGNRVGDRYLKALGNAGKLVPRNIDQLRAVLDEPQRSIRYDLIGNMAFIYYEENETS
ncbi:methylase involved in ubiquinone/menaquinone biosynthesis [Desulfosporosinus orientis DSM 765]|uniref:Methylase involved in ubiquinone/menaquinone biosynthesis n=1 Tax=Desulfosporosinus orientis (strain ATCC 19365 / DSM 765 / NCIMB 8382 / VKM B-1628 / Singapore I) TaxID=768706 RepID=G7WFA1_DESOD|nr:class I SAM-dependent methyltransferase [Desulfosporosinus orientis]AET67987.1 methylase involved in ubiquinone/menaquinone biosynthesis [Desulfosporosinus orientis DSM 765]